MTTPPVLVGAWLLAIGVPFAIWPTQVSHIADQLRVRSQNRVSPRQAQSARLAGFTIATPGALIVLAAQVTHVA